MRGSISRRGSDVRTQERNTWQDRSEGMPAEALLEKAAAHQGLQDQHQVLPASAMTCVPVPLPHMLWSRPGQQQGQSAICNAEERVSQHATERTGCK